MQVPGLVLVCALGFGAGYCEGLKTTPTEAPTCDNVAGAYKLAYSNTCGKNGNAIAVTVTQTGCAISADLSGIGSLTGTLQGSKADVTVAFPTPCAGTGRGSVTHEGHSITGSYSGTQTGTDCCETIAGTFTLSQ